MDRSKYNTYFQIASCTTTNTRAGGTGVANDYRGRNFDHREMGMEAAVSETAETAALGVMK